MTLIELENLKSELLKVDSVHEKIGLLNRHPRVADLLSRPSFFSSFLSGLTPECECVLKQLAAIGQLVDPMVESAERWRELLNVLLPIDAFYRELGGLIGYQVEVLRLLKTQSEEKSEVVQYHSPTFEDISEESEAVTEAIGWGLEAIPKLAELYPLGGAADRLHLIDEETGSELPAAKLRFGGRTLLERLIRDLEAREWLYFRLYGVQYTTPVAIMTSKEKDNHRHVMSLCEQHLWFGRGKESFRFFIQPLVPAVDEKGDWHAVGVLKPLLKPGGHGAIWKLARDEGVFRWFAKQGRKKALVRQINNPAAGLDYGLLAFSGIGWKRDLTFGFASCPRLVKSAEGMNVVIEKQNGEVALTNIEYCDFAKVGIEDRPLHEGTAYSRFSSNTNILFADLTEVEKAVEKSPFPGLLINVKGASMVDESGFKRDVQMGRLESTMQNLADVFTEPKPLGSPFKTKRTFVTYNRREKTISVAKKAFVAGKPLLETTEQCFYELLQVNRSLLAECGFTVPDRTELERYLEQGPDCLFSYHPALGPLYSIIRQKLRGGSLQKGSELVIELAEMDAEELYVDGSLRICAQQPLGLVGERLAFSSLVSRCRLKNVTVLNQGVDWVRSGSFWKMELTRHESLTIDLQGNSEFFASDLVIRGSHHFVVKDGIRMTLEKMGNDFCLKEEPVSLKPLWNYEWERGVKLKSGE